MIGAFLAMVAVQVSRVSPDPRGMRGLLLSSARPAFGSGLFSRRDNPAFPLRPYAFFEEIDGSHRRVWSRMRMEETGSLSPFSATLS